MNLLEKIIHMPKYDDEITLPRKAYCTNCGYSTNTMKWFKLRCTKCQKTIHQPFYSLAKLMTITSIPVPQLVCNIPNMEIK